jgi:hypothetical protein
MTIQEQKIYHLGFFEEAVGVLTELAEENGLLIARISDLALILPLEMEDKLRPLVGTRMGILHTDIPGRDYLLRVIPEIRRMTASMTDQDLLKNEQIPICCEAT